jgi:hypothetical protein
MEEMEIETAKQYFADHTNSSIGMRCADGTIYTVRIIAKITDTEIVFFDKGNVLVSVPISSITKLWINDNGGRYR